MREPLGVNALRSVEKGVHLIIDLHEDEYWEGAEGFVSFVHEYDSGTTHVGLKGLRGHPARLKIPEDGREALRFSGAAKGATNLKVTSVYEK